MSRPSLARLAAALAAALALTAAAAAAQPDRFGQRNLVSNLASLHPVTVDPLLVNPWGISLSATSPFWVSNADAGVSTLYNGAGTKLPLVVPIPGPL
jgi:hypothetical protein